MVIGPKVPQLDSLMRPCSVLADAVGEAGANGQTAPVGAGTITVVSDLASVPATVAGVLTAAGVHEVTTSDPRLDVTVHSDPDDASAKLVFIANPSAEPIDAHVDLGVDLKEVTEVWAGREVDASGSAIHEPMEPYSIHVYRCTVTA